MPDGRLSPESDTTSGMTLEKITLPTPRGIPVVASRITPAGARATLIFSPALGVHAGFYDRLARAIASRGIEVILHEQRGHGDSPVRAGRGRDWGYRELLEEELAMLADHARATAAFRPLFLGGHSLGGQLACLHGAAMRVPPTGLVVIASAVQYHRLYRPSWRARVLIGASLFPALSRIRGFHEGSRMGFGGREAARLMADWARVARTGRYEPRGTAINYEARLAQLAVPALFLTFSRDDFAPARAARGLMAKLPRATITHLDMDGAALEGSRPDHFDWARRPEPVARVVSTFVIDGK